MPTALAPTFTAIRGNSEIENPQDKILNAKAQISNILKLGPELLGFNLFGALDLGFL